MLAIRNLTRRKIRTTLTVLGVAVGIAAVVALVAVARGIRQQFNGFFATEGSHLVLTRAGAADPFISYLPDTLIDRLRDTEGVAAAHPVLFAVHQIPGQTFFFFYGTTDGSPLLDQARIVEGRGIFDQGAASGEICLGRTIAEHLGLRVGSSLALGGESFEVVGIFESQTPLMESGGMLPFADAQRVAGLEGKMSSALLRLVDFTPEGLAQAEKSLEANLPAVEATGPAEFSNAFDEFRLLDDAVVVFTILAVVIGGLGVMNTMLMSVFERTREIGILQALGWSKRMILIEVVIEGLTVCLIAGPVGIALGVATVEAVGSIGELGWVSGDYGLSVFVQALVVAIGMALVGAVYPALRAVRITPVEALRYE